MAVGHSGMYQWSVALHGYISTETGKAPTAFLWIPEGCREVKAVMVAQQNMTEEMLYKMPSFQKRMKDLNIALVWVAPWFSRNWEPTSGLCRSVSLLFDFLYKFTKNFWILQLFPYFFVKHNK